MKTFIVIFSIFFLISCSGFPVSKTPSPVYIDQLDSLQKKTTELDILSKILLKHGMLPKWKEGMINLKTDLILTTIGNLRESLNQAGGVSDRCYIIHGAEIVKCKKELKGLYRIWETATMEIFPCLIRQRLVKNSRK